MLFVRSIEMLRIGITGQSGFIGTHIHNTLGLFPEKFERIPFEDSYFNDDNALNKFVQSCDAIIHLAALNRHNDPDIIYKTNIELVQKLINACSATGSVPHILFSSSSQEELSNKYGESKKEGRILLEKWAGQTGARFTGLVIPNVFGSFGHPYYNSVIATFCHQLTHSESPKVIVDNEVSLIHVSELINLIIREIEREAGHEITKIKVPANYTKRVSEILKKLERFALNYLNEGIIPDLTDAFDRHLFNTLVTYIEHKSFYPFILRKNSDERGIFVETLKLNSGGQVSFSTTKPGITRGNHYHTRKAERFAVIKGKARIELRRIGTQDKISFDLDGNEPSFVDMPIWYSHNITNTGSEDLYTIFWINECFDPNDPDTYFEKV